MMNWVFKKLSTNSNVNGYEVDNLPLKINNIDELCDKVRKYIDCKSGLEFKDVSSIYEGEFNKIVYDIYGLNSEEIKYIEEN